MKELLKKCLKKGNIYHPLQRFYRSSLSTIKRNYYRVTWRRFRGRGYTCNYCGAEYKKFVPEYPGPGIAGALRAHSVIAGFGDNAICPNCLSKNRERLLKAVIAEYLPIAGKRLLHFSPERNLYRWLRQQAAVTTVDLAPGFYRDIDPQITFADATKLSFADGSFDVVIANHILEHIPDDRKAMREIYRVLNPQGVAILQVPYSETLAATIEEPEINDPDRQAARFGQKDHVRIYALRDYVQRLEAAGFRVRLLDPPALSAFRIYAIQENETVILCYSPIGR
jgi:SAM-dependent methyltransferase